MIAPDTLSDEQLYDRIAHAGYTVRACGISMTEAIATLSKMQHRPQAV